MPFPDYKNAQLLFVYSKKHDYTPIENIPFRIRILKPLPTFKGKPYTSAIIVGHQFNIETASYFDYFDDAVVLGIGTLADVQFPPSTNPSDPI